MKNLVRIVLFSLLFSPLASTAQINAYAKVTAIAGATLTVNNVNETYHTFEVGDKVIVIQMQDASIGSNTGNDANFGTISAIQTTGNYEIATISSIAESGGVPTSITLQNSLTKSYNPSASCQVVSYRKMGTTTYTTTANINALSWDGNVGGIVAFYVTGKLNLSHNISASAAGFRGGVVSGSDGGGCNTTTFRNAVTGAFAAKGEGVYPAVYGTTSGYAGARAKLANGGGGGNVHNLGGGGGGNLTAGGNGSVGWSSCAAEAQGGVSMSSYASSSRIFMGGGGGAGQQNNAVGTSGANGGGIILIAADSIVISGTCSARSITANGGSASNTPGGGNDGAGGGGAGGSIVLSVTGIRIQTGCPLTVSANGGNGGSVTNSGAHGAGGGGGQGAIYVSTGSVTNLTLNTVGGTGGATSSSTSASRANSGSGTTNTGVSTGVTLSPLPVELIYIKGIKMDKQNRIEWATASEENASHYELYRSTNGIDWFLFDTKLAAGTTKTKTIYYIMDEAPAPGLNYYRIKQVDRDGAYEWFKTVVLDNGTTAARLLHVYPNPVPPMATLNVTLAEAGTPDQVSMVSMTGQETLLKWEQPDSQHIQLVPGQIPAGTYILKVQQGGKLHNVRFMVTEQ